MKFFKQNIWIYLFVVLLPSLIVSSIYINYRVEEEFSIQKENTKWIASIHQRQWDQFISETITILEILSLMAESAVEDPDKIEPLLAKIHQKDPRYGGLYLLSQDGTVIAGSNSFLKNVNLSKKEYFQEVVKAKDTIISSEQEILENKQNVISLATPVLNSNRELSAVLIAHLRIDYMKIFMNTLTPNIKMLFVNTDNKVIFNLNIDDLPDLSKEWISVPIDRLPWNIKVQMTELNKQKIILDSSLFIIIILIIAHILFLLIKYVILKRQASREKAQIEAQKLELVGTLAASTAHEIRNPLTGIKGLVQLLNEKYNSQQDQFYFSVINKEIERINEIVSEFLILGRPTAQKTEKIDLRMILLELEPIILSEANLNNIHYEFIAPDFPLLINCTKNHMKQVILNISKNAFESMENEGSLIIHLSKEKKDCILKIVDTGIGIEEDKIDDIFKPFYTSKDYGTGLGLIVCNRIIQSFNGNIQIHSKKNKGTTVTITLPLA
ncbi:two-component sensor histidine kinase [Bacillus aquiflavi]|uniref:histidine kinase n=1 Tax=Bacillus aquiflavi TaxID=2672567 RepID=A0A6B3W182_9BACI|nr:PAS domain-containing sensor histidine kinase [Bacillus aquiflavi]MBA4537380.1 two-component sensor histidine kinase [Bacillus aquiflavi]NEY81636.1 two-component sensor histidine kinase [Bacillus aquiflavi]